MGILSVSGNFMAFPFCRFSLF